MTSQSARCMTLVRLIVLEGLTHNVRVFAKHVPGKINNLSDSLSRRKFDLFRKQAREQGRIMNELATPVPETLIDMQVVWNDKYQHKRAEQ